MNTLRTKVQLLRKQGHGIKEIARALNIGKSTASAYAKGIEVEDKERLSKYLARVGNITVSAVKANRERWAAERAHIIRQARIDWETVKKDPDTLLFLGLYWGEGNKNRTIGITNNDPALLKCCYQYLSRNTEAKIVLEVKYYPSHDPSRLIDYWSTLLGIRPKLTPNRDSRSKPEYNPRCPYGTGRITISDYRLYWRIMTWIQCFRELFGGDTCRTPAYEETVNLCQYPLKR